MPYLLRYIELVRGLHIWRFAGGRRLTQAAVEDEVGVAGTEATEPGRRGLKLGIKIVLVCARAESWDSVVIECYPIA